MDVSIGAGVIVYLMLYHFIDGRYTTIPIPLISRMALVAGDRFGRYDVLATLGSGGMGEVYRARDTKLGRDVALKVLPDVFASDAERLRRFQREALVLASLSHPHIGAITIRRGE